MLELDLKQNSTGFKIGWGLLLFLAAGNILGHIGLLTFSSFPKGQNA